jgi:hypothetical protein
MYVQQDATLHSLFYLETALHISGGTPSIIRSANNDIYSFWYLSHRYCYLPLSWESWNLFECAVGDDGLWYHPKHIEQFPDKINRVTLHLVGHILEYS